MSLLKDFFELNPLTHVYPAHQTTSFTVDQKIQLARAVGLEVSLASFGRLDNLLLKATIVRGKNGDVKTVSGKSSFPGCAGTIVYESVALRSVYSLHSFSELTESRQEAEVGLHELCSSRQAAEAFSSAPTACSWSGTDSMKTLKEKKTDLKKKSNNPYRWSREVRPDPILGCAGQSGGFAFTKEMLALATFAKIFATGPKEPLQENIVSLLCSVKKFFHETSGLHELKRHYHLRINQRF